MKIHSQQQMVGTLRHIREANDGEVQIVPGKKRELTPMGKTVLTVMAACVVLGIAGVSLFEWKRLVNTQPAPPPTFPAVPPPLMMRSFYFFYSRPGFSPKIFSNWRQTSPKTFPELLEGDVGPGWFALSKSEQKRQLYALFEVWYMAVHATSPDQRKRCFMKVSSRKANGQRIVVGYSLGYETVVDPYTSRNTILHPKWLDK